MFILDITMSLQQNIFSQDSSNLGVSSADRYKSIIDNVVNCVNEQMLLLINQMLNSANEKLSELAEKAKTDEQRVKFTNCIKIFNNEKSGISQLFFISLNNSLVTSQDDLTNLQLVDQDEMEEMVAITTMHSKAMTIYGDEVHHLEARLEYLEIVCEDIFDKEALDPKHLCEVFQKTIENLQIDIQVKLICYKLFDQEVCSKLGVMYKTINQIFIDNGIMPEIIMKTTKNEEIEYLEDEVTSRVATYYDPNENVATDFIPRTKEEISRVVNEFMSGEMTITGDEIDLPESFLRAPTKKDLDGKSCYERKEVVKALSKLQYKLSSLHDKTSNITAEEIKQELLNNISNEHGGVLDKQVSLLDERSIDFVGMMFGAIADDTTVSEIMTNLIYQLQVPVMKITMSDNTMFEDDEHPARATVDLLTAAGKGINNVKDRLYNKLEAIVDDILDNFDIDIVAFEKAVTKLEDIIKKEEALTAETERQQQKQIFQDHARHIVTTQLKMISCNKKIPDNVRPLVLKHWSTLMLNRYIKHGRNSSQWAQSVSLLKLLVKCMQPIRFQSQFNLIKSNHNALIEAVNDELYETQQDKKDISSQITKLKEYFLARIDDYGLKVIDQDNSDFSEEEVLADDSSEDSYDELQQTEIAAQKISLLSSNTKPGVWYEIYNGEDRAVRRLKLSVILSDTAQLIFVDRKGMKVIEKDAEEFARELEEDRSRLLADHSTFDHALGKVISSLAA